jgi:hypothetical protein
LRNPERRLLAWEQSNDPSVKGDQDPSDDLRVTVAAMVRTLCYTVT